MNAGQNSPIRVGIAGLGRSGWGIHARAIRPMADKYKIVAVSDLDAGRCKEAADEFACKTYDRFEGLAGDSNVELLVVASPSHMHPDHVIKALRAGKQVVCEKPMARTAADADRMIAAAKETGNMLAVFQDRRYSPEFLKIREVIDSGKLGRIVMIRIAIHGFSRRWDWQTLQEYNGGSLNNTGPHMMDHALQLFGQAEDPEIFCHLERTLTSGDAEDHCKVILKGKTSPMIDIEITSCCACGQKPWLVMGTQGGLRGGASSLRWRYVDFSKLRPRPVDRTPTPDRSYNHEDLPWSEETWTAPKGGPSDAVCFYIDLYDTIRNAKPLYITAESVRRQIAVLEKCHELSPV